MRRPGASQRASNRSSPLEDTVRSSLSEALGDLRGLALTGDASGEAPVASSPAALDLVALERATQHLDQVDEVLSWREGARALVLGGAVRDAVQEALVEIDGISGRLEQWLEASADSLDVPTLEAASLAVRALLDRAWSLRYGRIAVADGVRSLLPAQGPAADDLIDALGLVELALSALGRLEVRGRDSAGLYLLVSGHAVARSSPLLASRTQVWGATSDADLQFVDKSVRWLEAGGCVDTPEAHLGFVYKTAAEIGELGDNVRDLRASIRSDALLREALSQPGAEVTVLGHTRWASVGLINQPNAHPVNGEEASSTADGAEVVAVLNGDVDNYAALMKRHGVEFPEGITTDAKVIPTLVSRGLSSNASVLDSFRETVASFEGSVAIGASVARDPGKLYFALRGSGQALYVGVAGDAFIVASEPYGVVELTQNYLRLDGETPGNLHNPDASRGQIVVLDRERAGELEGVSRWAYDGTLLPVSENELRHAEITTRDVDRKGYPHYLLKEISEAPLSFRKTLRGKIRRSGDGSYRVDLGDTLPKPLCEKLASGEIRRLYAIGQGTAAIAARGAARALESMLPRSVAVSALPATELSGFGLDEDMSDALVVAVSQSGTTTDTNRTVDLVRQRGASVIAIVNRRHSDLTDKADGVLYTSDGRDVEMSVASTKAFYSQIAAGFLLGAALSEILPESAAAHSRLARERSHLLEGLLEVPAALEATLELAPQIEAIAERHAPEHRYWALVGNGWNHIAAEEVRIKLSELCYKSIACDTTEDKKHIDLSAEPLILVMAAGLQGSTADDVAKEVAIYCAHKATPIVIANPGRSRFSAAAETVEVPPLHPSLAFVPAVMAGHLFGYHAALAIDRSARPLREMRSSLERIVAEGLEREAPLLERLAADLREPGQRFLDGLRERRYNGHLEASTAYEVAALLPIATGALPLDAYRLQSGRPGGPGAVADHLAEALTRAIEELTRPVDAIKHQAKTVTVGISRADETLLTVRAVADLFASGVPRDSIAYDDLRALAALDPVIEAVTGFTRYRIEGDADPDEGAEIRVVGSGGIAKGMRSRVRENSTLRGTKHTVARDRRMAIARGRSDGRTVIIVPEIQGSVVTGIVLLHADYKQHAPVSVLRGVLRGYRNRYSLLRDAVMETEPSFDEERLETITVEELLCDPITGLAERLRGPEISRLVSSPGV